MRAVYEEREEVVQAILEQPAIDLDRKNDQGATALHLAAVRGNERLARALLLAGASPLIRDREGRTAALLALAAGHEDVAELLESGATQ